METTAGKRSGMPRSVIVTPVLMLVAGAAASVGLWVLLNQDAPRLVRINPGSGNFAPSRGQLKP